MSDPLRSATHMALVGGRARSAARAGRLDDAARLLDDAGATGSDSVAALDLRARVFAQAGDLTAAGTCWARVLDLEPGHADATEGRRVVEAVAADRRRARPLVTTGRVAAVTVVLLVGLSAFGITLTVDAAAERAVVAAADRDRLQRETGRAEALLARLTSADTAQRTAVEARARDLNAIVAELSMPGVLAQARAHDVEVVFDDGLFTHDAAISTDGAALLVQMGRRLAAADVRTTVVGHTATVAGAPTAGGSTVALSRTRVAVDYLSQGGVPLTAFSLVTAEQAAAPFPDAARNRTVTLQVAPADPDPGPR